MPWLSDPFDTFDRVFRGGLLCLDEHGLPGLTWERVALAGNMSVSAVRHRSDGRRDRLTHLILLGVAKERERMRWRRMDRWAPTPSVQIVQSTLPRDDEDRRVVRVWWQYLVAPELPELTREHLAKLRTEKATWARVAAPDEAAPEILALIDGLELATSRRVDPLPVDAADGILEAWFDAHDRSAPQPRSPETRSSALAPAPTLDAV